MLLVSMPHEIHVHIARNFAVNELLYVRLTCRTLQASASDDAIWRCRAGKRHLCGSDFAARDSNATCFVRACASRRRCSACAADVTKGAPQPFFTTYDQLEASRRTIECEWTLPDVKVTEDYLLVCWPTPHGTHKFVRATPSERLPPRSRLEHATDEELAHCTPALLTGEAAAGWSNVPRSDAEASAPSGTALRFTNWALLEQWLHRFLAGDAGAPAAASFSSVLQRRLAEAQRALQRVLRSGDVAIVWVVRALHEPHEQGQSPGVGVRPSAPHCRDRTHSACMAALHLPTRQVFHTLGFLCDGQAGQ